MTQQRTHQHRARGRWVVAGVAPAVAALVGGAAAYAFWSADGHGVDSASTQVMADVTLSSATPEASLYPGGTATVELTITNPNAAAVHIGSLALDDTLGTGGFGIDTDHSACDPSTLSFTTATNDNAGWTVAGAASGTGQTAASLPAALSMSADATNACQGAVVTVYLVAGP